MFIEKLRLADLTVGEYRNDRMQIVSGSYGKQIVDFEAPCRSLNEVNQEMEKFIDWLNQDDSESLYIKSAIAKFYFVTIHPFDDGNGRLSRIIGERLLAQAENSKLRLFSLSKVIEEHRKEYYQELNDASKGDGDLTNWIVWYLSRVIEATQYTKQTFHKVLATTKFWQEHSSTSLNERQTQFIKRLLDTDDFGDGITRQKYQSLTKTTTITANRDLKKLVDKGIVEVSGSSRSTRYVLKALKY